MCKHVCSNKIVYFTISALAVVSLLLTDNISTGFILKGLCGLLHFPLLRPRTGSALCGFQAMCTVLIEQVSEALTHFLLSAFFKDYSLSSAAPRHRLGHWRGCCQGGDVCLGKFLWGVANR